MTEETQNEEACFAIERKRVASIPTEVADCYLGGIPISGVHEISPYSRRSWLRLARRYWKIGLITWIMPPILATTFVVFTLNQGFGLGMAGLGSGIAFGLMMTASFSPCFIVSIGRPYMMLSKGLRELAQDDLTLVFEIMAEEHGTERGIVVFEVGWPSQRNLFEGGVWTMGKTKANLQIRSEVPSTAHLASLFARPLASDEATQFRALTHEEIEELKPIRSEIFWSVWKGNVIRLYITWIGFGGLFSGFPAVTLLGIVALLTMGLFFWRREQGAITTLVGLFRDMKHGQAVVCLDRQGLPIEFLPHCRFIWTLNSEAAPWRFVPFRRAAQQINEI